MIHRILNATRILRVICIAAILLIAAGALKTRNDLLPLPLSLKAFSPSVHRPRIFDRNGIPLTVTYQDPWNVQDVAGLHDIPEFLQKAFVASEDRRFFQHRGVDWLARAHALWQNLCALGAVRGASTITEQAVRMLHPRPRTIWSRWLEGIEAGRLEALSNKADILELYLNQVPYAANRRGVVQAARYAFDRDLDTLNRREMMALAVLVRAPGRMDLHRAPGTVGPAIEGLARRMVKTGTISETEWEEILREPLQPSRPGLDVQAGHFVAAVFEHLSDLNAGKIRRVFTTLDGSLQRRVQEIVDRRLKDLKGAGVFNAAALVADHISGDVLAWVVGVGDSAPGAAIDGVTVPRQPGSALKPFLYALALEKGWTTATVIDDAPLTESVGAGLHTYHNYNRAFYGPVTLREALGNSLNIPALHTVQYVGVDAFLGRLRDLGFHHLSAHPDHYGDGLALGNGEVTLLELVSAYATLARGGMACPLAILADRPLQAPGFRVFPPGPASLIADILSDPEARRLEFGAGSLLRFPVQTAVKTGTSSDFRDAWAVGFNDRFTAGVWMGNLDRTPTDGITGSTGPALALRSIFSELNRFRDTRPLYRWPALIPRSICRPIPGNHPQECAPYTEWFIPGTEPVPNGPAPTNLPPVFFRQPTPGLRLAMDPRIPDDREAFELVLSGVVPGENVEWIIDDAPAGKSPDGRFLWSVTAGDHSVRAVVWRDRVKRKETGPVRFSVQ